MTKDKSIDVDYQKVPDELATEIGHVIHAFSFLEAALKNVIKRSNNVSLKNFRREKRFREYGSASLGAVLNGITAWKPKILLWGLCEVPDKFYIGLVQEAKKNPIMKPIASELDEILELLPLRKKYSHTPIYLNSGEWFFDGGTKIDIVETVGALKSAHQRLDELIKKLDKFLRVPNKS